MNDLAQAVLAALQSGPKKTKELKAWIAACPPPRPSWRLSPFPPNRGACDMEIPERALWQTVIFQALQDACRPYCADGEARRAKREADLWLRYSGRNFKHVCQMAGFDDEFIRDAYVRGRIKTEHLFAAHGLAKMNSADRRLRA